MYSEPDSFLKELLEKDSSNVPSKWLPEKAAQAFRISLTTHPGKLTNPDAKEDAILAVGKRNPDGYIRTGNTDTSGYAYDGVGSAAYIPIYKFLFLKLGDRRTIWDHLQDNSAEIREYFESHKVPYTETRANFLKMAEKPVRQTCPKIKQVYFPVSDGRYHLLSIVQPSLNIYSFKDKIQSIRFSEQASAARKDRSKKKYNEHGFDELYNLTMIGFGGTKPQTVSMLNSAKGGKAYLIPCLPPEIKKRGFRMPTTSFFSETLNPASFRDLFKDFHKVLSVDSNNASIRASRDVCIRQITQQVIWKMYDIRNVEPGWSETGLYSRLPAHQKIWLDNARVEFRGSDEVWLDQVVNDCARWFIVAYRICIGSKAENLGRDEFIHTIKKVINQNRDGFR